MQQPPQYPAQGQQGVVYVQPPPQPNYIIQNVPPPQNDCCGGPSEQYSAKGALGTGITHLVIGIFCVILSGASYAYPFFTLPYGIWSGVLFYIPAGILGIISKNKSTGVITGYLVMGILSALEAFGMVIVEGIWSGVWSIDDYCVYHCSDFTYINCSQYCRSEGSTAIHAILAILAFFEFIVSIVGAAYCCGGLRCCCASPTQTTTTTIQYQNQPQQVAIPVAQPQGKM